jgi:Cation transporting ATPase, C-terminus
LLSNRPLVGAILLSTGLQAAILAAEPLHPVFGAADLRPQDWLVAVAVAVLPVPVLEWLKTRRRTRGGGARTD